MVKPKSLAYDLRYLQAGLGLLEAYLLSQEVFWPVGEKPPDSEIEYPQLTLDGLLLTRERLLARPKSASQEDQVAGLISDLDVIRSRYRVAWEGKALHCYRVRLNMWRDYLQEYQDNPGDNAERYAYEVRLRAMLTLSGAEIGFQNKAEIQLLDTLDRYLVSVLVPGGFIWEAELEAGFPTDRYWYLYGKLPR